MTDEAKQDNLASEPLPPDQAKQTIPFEAQAQMMRNATLNSGLTHYQSYRTFIKQMPIEPSQMSALLQKLDDTWVWVRVIVADMQINPPQS